MLVTGKEIQSPLPNGKTLAARRLLKDGQLMAKLTSHEWERKRGIGPSSDLNSAPSLGVPIKTGEGGNVMLKTGQIVEGVLHVENPVIWVRGSVNGRTVPFDSDLGVARFTVGWKTTVKAEQGLEGKLHRGKWRLNSIVEEGKCEEGWSVDARWKDGIERMSGEEEKSLLVEHERRYGDLRGLGRKVDQIQQGPSAGDLTETGHLKGGPFVSVGTGESARPFSEMSELDSSGTAVREENVDEGGRREGALDEGKGAKVEGFKVYRF